MTESVWRVRAEKIVADLTPRERAELTVGRNGARIADLPGLDVRPLRVMDGPLGLVADEHGRNGALVLPSPTCLGASFDPEVVRDVGRVLGEQSRAVGVDVVMGPNLNLPRMTKSGRSFEMFSEDPLLTGVLGSAWIEGLDDWGVAACAKHVVCNDTETARQTMNVEVGDRDLREIYLLPFEYAVRNGVRVMMTAYNRVRGKWSVEQEQITSILRDEWGYDGVLISDFFAKGSTVGAATARVDVEMPGPASYLGPFLADAIESGEVDQSLADDSARRIAALALAVDSAQRALTAPPAVDRTEALRTAAAGGMVLLSNERGILPLRPADGQTIAVIGPNATRPCFQGGTFGRIDLPEGTPTPLEALTAALAPARVISAEGTTPEGMLPLESLAPTTPDGDSGVLVEYFHEPDHVLASEVRARASAVWWTQMPGTGTTFQPSRARMTAILVGGDADRDLLLHVGGTGAATLSVDGAVVAEWARPDVADIMGVVARADTVEAPVVLRAGARMEIVAEFDYAPSRVQSAELAWSIPIDPRTLEEALRVAAEADTVILVVGDEVSSSRESADRSTTALTPAQVDLIERVADLGTPVVVAVNSSRAVDLSWSDRVDGVLMTWFGGAEMSAAIADVITGEREPGGRLPMTLAREDSDYPGFTVQLDDAGTLDYDRIEPAGYAGMVRAGTTPRFAFGSGTGYTRFAWGEPTVGPFGADGGLIEIPVSNVGERRGKEVVQVYARTPEEPVGRLAAFASATIDAGETKVVRVALDDVAFRRWSVEANGWRTPGAHFILDIARAADDIVTSVDVELGT